MNNEINSVLITNCISLGFADIKTENINVGYKVTFYVNGVEVGHACTAHLETQNDFLYNVEVNDAFRGQGIGTKIMEYMLNSYPIEWLNVTKDNYVALKMYTKFGFEKFCNVVVEDKIMWRLHKTKTPELKETNNG